MVIAGPHTYNFEEIVDEFKEKKAACFVKDEKECSKTIEKLLTDKKLLNSYKSNADKLLASKKNILKKISDELIKYID